jgi:hypothetical protein
MQRIEGLHHNRQNDDQIGREWMGMKKRWLGGTVIVLGILALSAFARDEWLSGPFEDVDAAYKRGDYTTALRLFRPLADQGVAAAQSNLGLMYDKGQGVPQDYAEAMKWYRKAAEQGFAVAQSNLGLMYYKGQGVPQDYAEAMKWYRKAADQGHAAAQSDLGFMYANGLGVPRDDAAAVTLFRKAADQGNVAAQYNLGVRYEKGESVPQDFVQAHKWYNLAAVRSAPSETRLRQGAVTNRDRVSAKMTAVQIAEAQRFAREWKPK